MKPIELHLYLPFSYWLDRDPETGAPLRRPDERALSVWLRALCTELSSLKEDYADCEVTAVRFHGGYLSLLDAEDLSRLLIAVHRSFSLRKDCPVCGLMFPGRLDMEMVAAYGNRHVSPLLFTLPSLSFRECERLGYPVDIKNFRSLFPAAADILYAGQLIQEIRDITVDHMLRKVSLVILFSGYQHTGVEDILFHGETMCTALKRITLSAFRESHQVLQFLQRSKCICLKHAPLSPVQSRVCEENIRCQKTSADPEIMPVL